MDIIINKCFGEFNLSNKAFRELIKMGWSVSVDGNSDLIYESFDDELGKYYYAKYDRDFRTNLDVISVVKLLGDEANGYGSKLKIVEIPEEVEWEI